MSTNLTNGNGRTYELTPRDSVHEVVLAGKEKLQDLIRESTLSISDTLSEVREIISKCEAELDVGEEISVVIEPNRAVLSVKRNVRFAKDRP